MLGWNLLGYWGMYVLGTVLMFVVSLCTCKKYDLTKSQAVFFTSIAFLCDGCGAWLMGKIYTAVALSQGLRSSSEYAIYGAVILTPILLILTVPVVAHSWRKVLDMIALSEMFARAFAKLGCLFMGCCWGVESEFGFYNAFFRMKMFPSPLFEFITMLIIIFIGYLYAFKSKKYIPGSVYPFMAIFYATTRFFWEFTRYFRFEEERHLVLGMTFFQFLSVLTVILSVIWIIGLKYDWSGKVKAFAEGKRIEKEEVERQARAEKRKAKQKKK